MKVVGVVLFSLAQALISTVFSLGLALPVAYFFHRYCFYGKSFFLACAALLCIMPTKLVVFSIAQTFSLDGFSGIVLAHLMLNVPFSLFVLNLAYQKLDTTLLWVARDLGATSWQSYKDIELSFLHSTITSLFILLFLLHLTSYSIPVLLGTAWYHQTPDVLMSHCYNAGKGGLAVLVWCARSLVCIPLVVVLGMHTRLAADPDHRVHTGLCERYNVREHGWWWIVYGVMIAFFTLVPFTVLIISSCTRPVFHFLYQVAHGVVDPLLNVPVWLVVRNSILLALVSGVGTVVLASVLCFVFRSMRGRLSRPFFVVLTVLPIVLGSVGVGIFFAWLSHGAWIPAFVIGVVCHMFLNYPFAYRIISAQLDRYHNDMHKSAQALGATPFHALRTVVLPLARPALVTALSVACGLSLTEVGAGSVLQGTLGMTMPMAIHAYRAAGMYDAVLGVSLLLILLVLGMSLALTRWTSR